MELKFNELVVLTESVLSGIHFESLVPESKISECDDFQVTLENDSQFDRIVLLNKLLCEIVKHRPLPF